MLKNLKLKSITDQVELCNTVLSTMEKPSIAALERRAEEGKDSIRKRFKTNGYIYDKNKMQFVKALDGGSQKKFIKKTEDKKAPDKEKSMTNKELKDIDINKLKELIELLEPLKSLVNAPSESKGIEVYPIGEVQTKVFKIDTKVLKRWSKFTKAHKEYKVQQLITQALIEFMDNHK